MSNTDLLKRALSISMKINITYGQLFKKGNWDDSSEEIERLSIASIELEKMAADLFKQVESEKND